MDKERNLGVTEARFGLTLLTCLLVAIGYVALLRLGGTKDSSVDVSPGNVLPRGFDGPDPAIPSTRPELQVRVLTLEKPEDGHNEPASLAKRPSSAQQPPEAERR